MKVGNLNTTPGAASVAAGERKATPAKSPAVAGNGGGGSSSAKVELSSTAAQLTSASTDPTFDSAKVGQISDAIRDGKYQINHEKIADKLISNAQELLGRATAH